MSKPFVTYPCPVTPAQAILPALLNDAYVWIADGGEGQVFSFVDDVWTEGRSVVIGYSADFCNEFIKARTKLEIITKLYDCAGDNVEPKIVFES